MINCRQIRCLNLVFNVLNRRNYFSTPFLYCRQIVFPKKTCEEIKLRKKTKISKKLHHLQDLSRPTFREKRLRTFDQKMFKTIPEIIQMEFALSCKSLMENSWDRDSETSPVRLAYLPSISFAVNRQEYFFDDVLSVWWPALLSRLHLIGASDLVKGTICALNDLNHYQNRKYLSDLGGWTRFMVVVDHVLNEVLNLTPKTFSLFLFSLVSMMEANEKDLGPEKLNLTKKIGQAFHSYVSAGFEKRLNFNHFIVGEISFLTNVLLKLKTDKPSDECTRQIIHIYSKIFNQKFNHAVDCLEDLNRMVEFLLHFKIDATSYDDKFWSKCYERYIKYYQELPPKVSGQLKAVSLKNCLHVALEFNREEDFFKLVDLEFWSKEMEYNKQFIHKDILTDFLNSCLQKWSGNLEIIDQTTLTEVLSILKL